LDESDFTDPVSLTRFLYFTDLEQGKATRGQLQNTIDSLNNAKNLAIATRSPFAVTDESQTSYQEAYYSSGPKKVAHAFLELTEANPTALKIEKITLQKGDKHKDITLSELKELITPSSDVISFEYLKLKLKLDKKALENRLNTYLDAFVDGSLLVPSGIRYFSFEKQQTDIMRSLQEMAKKYGNKNITFTLEELAKKGGWYQKEERNYRPFETLCALERLGQLTLQDFRKHEIILSLNKSLPAQGDKSKKVSAAQNPIVEPIKSITFISENKRADKVSSFYINHYIHDVHKMQSLSGSYTP